MVRTSRLRASISVDPEQYGGPMLGCPSPPGWGTSCSSTAPPGACSEALPLRQCVAACEDHSRGYGSRRMSNNLRRSVAREGPCRLALRLQRLELEPGPQAENLPEDDYASNEELGALALLRWFPGVAAQCLPQQPKDNRRYFACVEATSSDFPDDGHLGEGGAMRWPPLVKMGDTIGKYKRIEETEDGMEMYQPLPSEKAMSREPSHVSSSPLSRSPVPGSRPLVLDVSAQAELTLRVLRAREKSMPLGLGGDDDRETVGDDDEDPWMEEGVMAGLVHVSVAERLLPAAASSQVVKLTVCSEYRVCGHLWLTVELQRSGPIASPAELWVRQRRTITIPGVGVPILACTALPNDQVMTVGSDGGINLWAPTGQREGEVLLPLCPPLRSRQASDTQEVRSCQIFPCQTKLLICRESDATIWSTSGQQLMRFNSARHAALFPDGERVFVVSGEGSCTIWSSNNEMVAFDGLARDVSCCAIFPSGTRVATGATDGSAIVWDALAGRPGACIRVHGQAIQAMAVLPAVRASGRQLDEGEDFPDTVNGVVLQSGEKVISVSEDGSGVLWSEAGVVLAVLEGHQDPLTLCVALPVETQHHARIGTFDSGGHGRLWTSGGRLFSNLPQVHTSAISTCMPLLQMAGKPKGLFVTTSLDGLSAVWSAATGSLLSVLKGHSMSLAPVLCAAVAFPSRPEWLVTGCKDGTAHIWPVAALLDAGCEDARPFTTS